jgi:hypothetical protein
MASELWWVSVGGNECEPARVVTEDGAQMVYTIGCNTGTLVSEGTIDLVQVMNAGYIPDSPKQAEEKRIAWEKQRTMDYRRGISHGYRRFD